MLIEQGLDVEVITLTITDASQLRRRAYARHLYILLGSLAALTLGAVVAIQTGWKGLQNASLMVLLLSFFLPLARTFNKRLGQKTVRLELGPTSVLVSGRRIAWGALKTIQRHKHQLEFCADNDQTSRISLKGFSEHQQTWLADHLRLRLEQVAPGSPEDVPEKLGTILKTSR